MQLYAFEALYGEHLRDLPLHLRKNNLDRLVARRPLGSVYRGGALPNWIRNKNHSLLALDFANLLPFLARCISVFTCLWLGN